GAVRGTSCLADRARRLPARSVSDESGGAGPHQYRERHAARLHLQERRRRCVRAGASAHALLRNFLYREPAGRVPDADCGCAAGAAYARIGTDDAVPLRRDRPWSGSIAIPACSLHGAGRTRFRTGAARIVLPVDLRTLLHTAAATRET